jgi:uncharacterized membrane protein
MMSSTIRTIALATSIGAGVSGGVFLAFSTFIMKALGRLPAPQAISAMQWINKFAPNPLFMTALFGTAAACAPLTVSALRHMDEPSSKYLLIGCALYVAGIVVTGAYHIPRNNALDLVDPTGAGSAEVWSRYLHGWTAWNHVRTATSIGGAVALLVSTRITP